MPTVESPTTSPSADPTSEVPSTSPTVMPSKAPTPDCHDFVLTPCTLESVDTVDVLWVIDTSTSISDEDYNDLMKTLGTAVGDFFPESSTAQLGVLQFASFPNPRIEISNGSVSEWSFEIMTMDRNGGSTFTKLAMDYGLETMW